MKKDTNFDKDKYNVVTQAIKNAVDVSVLLDNYGVHYQSNGQGNKYRSACPIHNGDRPDSFVFDNDSKTYKCFSNECHGDVFQFVMELEHCSFPEARKKLANMCNIDVGNWTDKKVKETQLQTFIKTVKSFGDILAKRKSELNGSGNIYRDYSELDIYPKLPYYCSKTSRRINRKTINDFDVRMGRLDEDPYKHLRFIIPIHDEYGNYIGQVTRTWYDVDRSKYWYVPQGLKKGMFVFNGNRAKRHVMDYDDKVATLFVCEGTFDVLKLWQMGYKNSVAIFGSKPSDSQIRIVAEMADRFILCFDNDVSGIKATRSFANMISDKSINADLMVFYIPIEKNDMGKLSKEEIRYGMDHLMTYGEWGKLLEERLDVIFEDVII